MSSLYFAYGSNLNIEQMAYRCPDAEPLFHAELPGWRLAFRHYLDIEPRKGCTVPGYVWSVTENCLRSLDRYEGVRSGHYERIIFRIDGSDEFLWSYRMVSPRRRVAPPSPQYLQAVLQGYQIFNIPEEALKDALARSKKGASACRPRNASAP